MVAPLAVRVPPAAYGGTELVVSLLTEELIRRGHEVTLFATGDSITSAELVAYAPGALFDSPRNRGLLESLSLAEAVAGDHQFDIVHNHNLVEALPMTRLAPTPILTTLHLPVDGDWPTMFARYHGWYNTISQAALRAVPPGGRYAGAVYNGIDPEAFPLSVKSREPFLLYFSRISPEKGPHLAIRLALEMGERLVLAGDLQAKDVPFYRRDVEPYVDGDQIQYLGRIEPSAKVDLLQRARCLLAPLQWDEPFGLFMVEAMSCGTPVIALRRGAAPEVIAHGRTGYVVGSLEEMEEAVGRVELIDPRACRARVEQQFSYRSMTTAYLRAYAKILDAEPARVRGQPIDAPPPPGPLADPTELTSPSLVPHVA